MNSKSGVFSASFTDVYGVEHPDGVCMVSSVNRAQNSYFDNAGETTSSNDSCSYQIRYWHSEAARAAGARHQEYLNSDGYNSFTLNCESGDDSVSIIEKCQQDFLQKVLSKQA
ncbi:MAG: hypothetical protein ACRDC0_16415 [Aeromonas veronii]